MASSLHRSWITKVRGGWTKEKIRKELKGVSANIGTSGKLVHREIAKYESAEQFSQNIFYHGTGGYVGRGLKPSITMSEREAESSGGGGYGERYWAISLSSSRNKAAQFVGQSRYGTVYPVVLKSGTNVAVMPEIQDAAELEDMIEDLWERGIDAVKLGDWDSEHSEQEIAILNPRAIFKYDVSESFAVFNQKKLHEPTDEQLKEIYAISVAITPQLDAIRRLPKAERMAAINDITPLMFDKGYLVADKQGIVTEPGTGKAAISAKQQISNTLTTAQLSELGRLARSDDYRNELDVVLDTER